MRLWQTLTQQRVNKLEKLRGGFWLPRLSFSLAKALQRLSWWFRVADDITLSQAWKSFAYVDEPLTRYTTSECRSESSRMMCVTGGCDSGMVRGLFLSARQIPKTSAKTLEARRGGLVRLRRSEQVFWWRDCRLLFWTHWKSKAFLFLWCRFHMSRCC